MLVRGCIETTVVCNIQTNFPNRMVAVVQHRHLVPCIQEEARCPRRLDPYYSRIFYDYHNGDIGSRRAVAEQAVTNREAQDDTNFVENGHAHFTKFIVASSVQTHLVDFLSLLVFW